MTTPDPDRGRRQLLWSVASGTLVLVALGVSEYFRTSAFSAVSVLGRPLGGGLNLPELLKEVARSYLQRAMDEAHGNKTKAAELVGLPSYQTLSNCLEKYEVKS
jgi:DNA-binding NtrC family response regulator